MWRINFVSLCPYYSLHNRLTESVFKHTVCTRTDNTMLWHRLYNTRTRCKRSRAYRVPKDDTTLQGTKSFSNKPSTTDLSHLPPLTLLKSQDGEARPRRRAQRNWVRGRYRQNRRRNHPKESQTIAIQEQIYDTQSLKGDSKRITIRIIGFSKCQKQTWRDDHRVWNQKSLQARSSNTSESFVLSIINTG